MTDLYAELGIGRGASADDIKAAHRRKVREHHPDRGGDKAKFQAIQLAYDTLKDDERRRRYDETGEAAGAEKPDKTLMMLGAILENLISQMLQDGALIERMDMRQLLVQGVQGKIRELKHENASLERAVAKAADLLKRWKRKAKAEGPDFIGDTIRRRERDMREQMDRNGAAQDAWKRAAKLLDDYEYIVDEMMALPITSTARATGTDGGIHFFHSPG